MKYFVVRTSDESLNESAIANAKIGARLRQSGRDVSDAETKILYLASREEQERTNLLNTLRPEAAARFVTREAAELICPLPKIYSFKAGDKRRHRWRIEWVTDEAPAIEFLHPPVPQCSTCAGSIGESNLTIHSESCPTRWTKWTENELCLHTIKVVSEAAEQRRKNVTPASSGVRTQ